MVRKKPAFNAKLDTLIDADLLDAVLGNPDPVKKVKEISIKLTGRLRKHAGDPKFKALGEREDLKNRHQQGLLLPIDSLKELLALAKDVVRTEREMPEEENIDRGKAALTALFEEARNGDTPVSNGSCPAGGCCNDHNRRRGGTRWRPTSERRNHNEHHCGSSCHPSSLRR